MFYEIAHLIVDVVGGLVVGACLLRAWMQGLRMGAKTPVGAFVTALTDWIVRPLRGLIPARGGLDVASLVAALVITLLAAAVDLTLRFEAPPAPDLLLGLTLVWLLKWTLYLAQLLILIAAVLSWVNPFSPFLPTFDALTAPLLAPLRRLLPRAGRIDFSPLVALLVIQITLILLSRVSIRVLGVL